MNEGLTFGERLRKLTGKAKPVAEAWKEWTERQWQAAQPVVEDAAECGVVSTPPPDEIVCGSKSEGGGLTCTRPVGHIGRCGEMVSSTAAKGWWDKPERGSGREGAFMWNGKWTMPEESLTEKLGTETCGLPTSWTPEEWAAWQDVRARCAAKGAPTKAARWIRHLIREAGEAVDHLEREGSSEEVLVCAQTVRARWVELLRDRGWEVDEVEVPSGHELSDLREWFDKGGRL